MPLLIVSPDNIIKLRLIEDSGEPVALDLVSRIVLNFVDSGVSIDSSANSDLLQYAEDGVISLKLSSLDLYRAHKATIVIYDPAHTEGQTAVDIQHHNLVFLFA